MEIVLIITSVLLVISIILNIINFIKLKKCSIILGSYLTYLDNISRIIEFSDEKLKKLDSKGIFSSDDEIGFIFIQIKEIQKILNDFIIK